VDNGNEIEKREAGRKDVDKKGKVTGSGIG
jgi:hypothetical protein